MAYYATYMPNELGELQKVVINAGVGFCLPFYGETAPPGTLACDGSEISREAYKELFAVLGTKAGAGDGTTTFNLPDFRGKWLMGADEERAAGTEIAEGVPDISGYFSNIRLMASHGVVYSCSGAFSQEMRTDSTTSAAQSTTGSAIFVNSFSAHNSNPIYGAQAHVTPASVALLWCIIYE